MQTLSGELATTVIILAIVLFLQNFTRSHPDGVVISKSTKVSFKQLMSKYDRTR